LSNNMLVSSHESVVAQFETQGSYQGMAFGRVAEKDKN